MGPQKACDDQKSRGREGGWERKEKGEWDRGEGTRGSEVGRVGERERRKKYA